MNSDGGVRIAGCHKKSSAFNGALKPTSNHHSSKKSNNVFIKISITLIDQLFKKSTDAFRPVNKMNFKDPMTFVTVFIF